MSDCANANNGDCDYYGFLNHTISAASNVPSDFDLVDAATNFSAQNITECQYFNLDENFPNTRNHNSLIILHINIRSLQKHFDSLGELGYCIKWRKCLTLFVFLNHELELIQVL